MLTMAIILLFCLPHQDFLIRCLRRPKFFGLKHDRNTGNIFGFLYGKDGGVFNRIDIRFCRFFFSVLKKKCRLQGATFLRQPWNYIRSTLYYFFSIKIDTTSSRGRCLSSQFNTCLFLYATGLPSTK